MKFSENSLRGRISSFMATDRGKIALLAVIILLLAAGGVQLSRVVSATLLRRDAQATARNWAMSLTGGAADLPDIIAGVTPSDATQNLLDEAMDVGHIYRIKVWDAKGNLVFVSDRGNAPIPATTIAVRHSHKDANAILSGKIVTEPTAVGRSQDPSYFAESYIPIKRKGAVIGVFEAYVDQTDHKALYERFFLISESIMAAVVLLAGGLPGWMVYRRMVDHRRAQAEAQYLAEHDTLTGLANRRRLGEAANMALSMTRRNGGSVAVLLFDLDRFKEVNDSFGHGAGDFVLQSFAKRLTDSVRTEDVVARLGGDEFVILQMGVTQPNDASGLAERLLAIASQPYEIGGLQVDCAASIGIAIAPADAEDWDALLSCADVALYKAKAEGRNGAYFFQAGMDVDFRDRRRLEVDLRRALSTNAFQLAFQPLFRLRDGTLLGFEALLRWPAGWTPETPAKFIPVAEECGLMAPIGTWVLETACRTAASWPNPMKIAVNLSPIQFAHGDIVAIVEEVLDRSGLNPALLELEVTESLWLQDTKSVLGQLQRLRALGVSIALDDFGTGYSSLTYLWKFPFDKVKIDRSFVMDMNKEPKAAAIVSTIVALGRILNLTIIAEGVELPAQAQALAEAGCDEVQGYLFGRPLTPAAARALVEEAAVKLLPATATSDVALLTQASVSA